MQRCRKHFVFIPICFLGVCRSSMLVMNGILWFSYCFIECICWLVQDNVHGMSNKLSKVGTAWKVFRIHATSEKLPLTSGCNGLRKMTGAMIIFFTMTLYPYVHFLPRSLTAMLPQLGQNLPNYTVSTRKTTLLILHRFTTHAQKGNAWHEVLEL
jgi:hypothetical protein